MLITGALHRLKLKKKEEKKCKAPFCVCFCRRLVGSFLLRLATPRRFVVLFALFSDIASYTRFAAVSFPRFLPSRSFACGGCNRFRFMDLQLVHDSSVETLSFFLPSRTIANESASSARSRFVVVSFALLPCLLFVPSGALSPHLRQMRAVFFSGFSRRSVLVWPRFIPLSGAPA